MFLTGLLVLHADLSWSCAFIPEGIAEVPRCRHRHGASRAAVRRWNDHLRIAVAESTSSRAARSRPEAHGQTLAVVVLGTAYKSGECGLLSTSTWKV